MKEHYSLETQYLIAAQTIKTAILQSQYQAVKLVCIMELDAISLKAPEINTGEPARSLISVINYIKNYLV